MIKILQARVQQYMNCELPDVQAGFIKGRGTRYQIFNICWVIKLAREFQGSPVWQALSGHKRKIPLAVVLPPPARGAGTLIPSAQRLVWAAKQPLGNAALGALFA